MAQRAERKVEGLENQIQNEKVQQEGIKSQLAAETDRAN